MERRLDSTDGNWLLVVTSVALGFVLFVYPLLLNIPLFDPDEGLHASIAQEMVERGDWVTPHFLGQPFFDKPILFFGAEALSLKLFGMNEIAIRLPGTLFGLLGVVTTALLAGRMFGRRTGLVTALTYATMILPTAMAQASSHDVALVPWVNVAIWLFWESDRARGWRTQIGFSVAIGVVLGLACLTKGLVGVALVGVAYGSSLLVTRRLSWAACLRGVAAMAVAALVASSWYLAMEIRNPGYLHYYFLERHVMGYVTETQRHGTSGVWYYLPVLFGGGLPWIAYLPVVVRDWWERRRTRTSQGSADLTLIWCWLLGGTVLLSLAQSKLATYVWPLFPAVAILAGVAWTRLLDGQLTPAARRWLALTFYSLCLTGPVTLPAAMLVVGHKYHLQFSVAIWILGILVALSSWLPPVLWRLQRAQGALLAGMASVTFQFAVIMAVVIPPIARVNTARDLAAYLNHRNQLPNRLVVVDERIGSLVFYLKPELRRQLEQNQLAAARVHQLDDAPLWQPDTLFAVAERRLRRVEPMLNLTDAKYERAGQYRVYTTDELPKHRLRPASPAVTAAACRATPTPRGKRKRGSWFRTSFALWASPTSGAGPSPAPALTNRIGQRLASFYQLSHGRSHVGKRTPRAALRLLQESGDSLLPDLRRDAPRARPGTGRSDPEACHLPARSPKRGQVCPVCPERSGGAEELLSRRPPRRRTHVRAGGDPLGTAGPGHQVSQVSAQGSVAGGRPAGERRGHALPHRRTDRQRHVRGGRVRLPCRHLAARRRRMLPTAHPAWGELKCVRNGS
jgi:4-amino-4-deoxy-L-arabinose transferase-like glycosyltransferase